MHQITYAIRCLSLALVLVAAFATLSPDRPAAAHFSVMDVYNLCMDNRMAGNQDRFSEYVDQWGVHHYSCSHEGGDLLICSQAPGGPPSCIYISESPPYPGGHGGGAGAPNKPEPHIGKPVPNSSHPADGQVADEYGPIESVPAGR